MSESPQTVPVCYRHPGRETYVRCTRCDRGICPDCMREASVGHQCPECVAEGLRTQRPAPARLRGGAAGPGQRPDGEAISGTVNMLCDMRRTDMGEGACYQSTFLDVAAWEQAA